MECTATYGTSLLAIVHHHAYRDYLTEHRVHKVYLLMVPIVTHIGPGNGGWQRPRLPAGVAHTGAAESRYARLPHCVLAAYGPLFIRRASAHPMMLRNTSRYASGSLPPTITQALATATLARHATSGTSDLQPHALDYAHSFTLVQCKPCGLLRLPDS